MTWINDRAAQSASDYRYIRFVGARILQAKELLDLQDLESRRDKVGFGAMFSEGASVNTKFTVSGTTVTAGPIESALPMLAFFNGAFEAIPGAVLDYDVKQTGSDAVYLNWVLWRVTSDGTYQGQAGCLTDLTLIDTNTNEPVGERGQLQIILSTDDSLASEPLDPVTMIAKNTSPIRLCTLAWADSALAVDEVASFHGYMEATGARPGVARLSTATSQGEAAAADDPRLSDERVPEDASVDTSKVSAPVTAGGTTSILTPDYKTGDTDGGVSSDRVVYKSIKAKLTDFLDWTLTKINYLLGRDTNHENRIAALEGKPEQKIDLSYHINQPLGRSGDQGTHPPVVRSGNDMMQGFEYHGAPGIIPNGGVAAEGRYALSAYDSENHLMGGIKVNGDYAYAEPNGLAMLAGLNPDGFAYATFYQLSLAFTGLMRSIRNGAFSGSGSGGGGTTGPLPLAGDVSGTTSSNSVDKLKGRPVSSTIPANGDALIFQNGTWSPAPAPSGGTVTALSGDVAGAPNATSVDRLKGRTLSAAAPQSGQVLTFDNGQWTPKTASFSLTLEGVVDVPVGGKAGQSIHYLIFKIGSYRVAWGLGGMTSGGVLGFPAGWSTAYTVTTASPYATPPVTVTNNKVPAMQFIPPNAGNGWKGSVKVDGSDPSAPDSWWLSVSVVSICPVAA